MSNTVEARANVAIVKGHPFQRNRYTLSLYINDVYTGLHWRVSRKELKHFPQMIVDNAGRLLADFGLMDEFYSKATGIPAVGTRVALTIDLGPFLKGHVGTVTFSRKDEGVSEENLYPVTVAFADGKGGEAAGVPLQLSEFTVVQ